MKNCAYCSQPMQDTARKCPSCHSYQDPKDIPGPRTEVASLVIQFVGAIAITVTIVGGVLGYFGLGTFKDMNTRYDAMSKDMSVKYDTLTQKNMDLLESTRQQNEKFSKDVSAFEIKRNEVLARSEKSNEQLNILLVKELSAHFEHLLDDNYIR